MRPEARAEQSLDRSLSIPDPQHTTAPPVWSTGYTPNRFAMANSHSRRFKPEGPQSVKGEPGETVEQCPPETAPALGRRHLRPRGRASMRPEGFPPGKVR